MGHRADIWIADDGTPFDNQKDMIFHELSILDAKQIEIFLEHFECSDRRKKEYRKVLIDWQAFSREESA